MEPPPGPQGRVARVLAGGGARGFAHLGVLRVLEREGWRPDLVVGTSAGAIVGAMHASGLSVAHIEAAADMEHREVVALNQGDAARAVLASCAVPGLYAPVRARGRSLADGQVVSPLPVLTARRLGAVRVLANVLVAPDIRSPSQLGLASCGWVTEAGEWAASAKQQIRALVEHTQAQAGH